MQLERKRYGWFRRLFNIPPVPYDWHAHWRKCETELFVDLPRALEFLPIVYHDDYNIKYYTLEQLFFFQSQKWKKVADKLWDEGLIRSFELMRPREATLNDLCRAHSRRYLWKVGHSNYLSRILGFRFLATRLNVQMERDFLKPMRLQAGGTALAMRLALEDRIAINIGGGFHRAHWRGGSRFSVYSDISMGIRLLREQGLLHKVLVVDVSADMCISVLRGLENPNADPWFEEPDTEYAYLIDVHNHLTAGYDAHADAQFRAANRIQIRLGPNATWEPHYRDGLQTELRIALKDFQPDLIVYVAGTDVLNGDRFGKMSLTEKDVVARDHMVFEIATAANVPIVMLTAGGFRPESCNATAASIANLLEHFFRPRFPAPSKNAPLRKVPATDSEATLTEENVTAKKEKSAESTAEPPADPKPQNSETNITADSANAEPPKGFRVTTEASDPSDVG